MKLIKKIIIRDPDGSPYLSRWSLHLPFGFALLLHQMHRPDSAREMHDHPWWFCTLVLRGGYIEQFRRGVDLHWRLNRPGCVRFNRAKHTHLVLALPRGECWTLVFRGPRRRLWGFHTICGWMVWTKYCDRVYGGKPVCEEDEIASDGGVPGQPKLL